MVAPCFPPLSRKLHDKKCLLFAIFFFYNKNNVNMTGTLTLHLGSKFWSYSKQEHCVPGRNMNITLRPFFSFGGLRMQIVSDYACMPMPQWCILAKCRGEIQTIWKNSKLWKLIDLGKLCNSEYEVLRLLKCFSLLFVNLDQTLMHGSCVKGWMNSMDMTWCLNLRSL